MTELKPYPKYKDSGVEWIGEVPEDWEVLSFTRVLESIVDYRGKTPEKVSDGIFLVTARNIKNGIIDYNVSQEFIKPLHYEEVMRRGKPRIGDVLFTTEAPLGEVANVDKEHIALAQRVIKFRGKENIINNYYLKYWILSQGFQDNLQTFATGSTAQGIKSSKLGKLLVMLPSYYEQSFISKYLNKKTSEIDSLIANKEKLIELLEEKRQVVITETVTKGLDPNVKMKDSGIEWIGEIPEHWEARRLKYLIELNPKKSEVILEKNDLVSFIPLDKIIEPGVIDYSLTKRLEEVYSGYTYICDKDIIMAKVTPSFENNNIAIANEMVNKVGFGT